MTTACALNTGCEPFNYITAFIPPTRILRRRYYSFQMGRLKSRVLSIVDYFYAGSEGTHV